MTAPARPGTTHDFALPDLGEGLSEGEILRWLVATGETVALNQPIVEVETAKAAVEIPSPHAGVIAEIVHAEGAVVDVGAVIVRFSLDNVEEAGTGEPGRQGTSEPVQAAARVEPGAGQSDAPSGKAPRDPVLVGYGVRTGSSRRRARHPRPTAAPPARPASSPPGAKPPLRKLAKQLGVELASVEPSGPNGVLTRADVQAAAAAGAAAARPAGAAAPEPSRSPVTSAHGLEAGDTRVPIKGVRKATAEAMVASAFTAPHVTLFMTADVTPALELVRSLREDPDFVGVRVTPLLLVTRALILACRRNPGVNASWDDAAQEIVLRRHVNVGVAAATPRGLLVPNIKRAETLDLVALARELQNLTTTAREGRTSISDMQDGTITVTNVGTFGVDAGTPILNPGEAAILCFGAVREQPWMWQGKMVPRHITQLALSFDHRLVDGELGARVLADIAAVLSNPTKLLTWA